MPYGDFLEIEGGRDEIRQIADALGLRWEKRILHSYLSIFAKLKEKLGFLFSDLSFDNFKSLNFDFSAYSPMFEAGR
jgi:adenylate cyclase class 2